MRTLALFSILLGACASTEPVSPPATPTPTHATAYQPSQADGDRAQREAEDRARAEHPARETPGVVTMQTGTPQEKPRGREVDPTECGDEWTRKMVWVNQHCQRQRVDTTTADTSRVVATDDGRLANDTFTQSDTIVTCPADAPDEMKRFAKAHRHCKSKRN